MDDRGNIYTEGEAKNLKDSLKETLREIPINELPEVQGMNGHQRRKWYAQNKKRLKKFA